VSEKKKKPSYNNKELTRHLRELAAEAHDMDEGGRVITKGEAMGILLFKKALGGKVRSIDDEGRETEVELKPEAWAIQLIYDRMEGKTPQALPENADRVTAKDKVSDLAKQRINAMAGATDLKTSGPPPMST